MILRTSRALAVIALLAAGCSGAHAQYEESNFSYGLSFGTGFKGRIADRKGLKYRLWGEGGFGMYAAYRGSGLNSMTARLHGQFTRDDLYMKVGRNEGYVLETINCLLNPEVAMPIGNRYGDSRLDLLLGIGAQYTITQGFGRHNVDGFFGGSSFDRLADTFFDAQRKLVPFVTAGIGIRFHRRAAVLIRVRQDAQNAFETNREVTLYSTTDIRTVKLSAMPTRLLIGFVIRLGKLPEIY